MTDDEELGAITAPMKGVRTRSPLRPTTLEPHPAVNGVVAPCDLCCRKARGYRHPNPLRSGVVVWRCSRHRFPTTVRDDPKVGPGGGRYR